MELDALRWVNRATLTMAGFATFLEGAGISECDLQGVADAASLYWSAALRGAYEEGQKQARDTVWEWLEPDLVGDGDGS
jgi:hypothetical protein